MHRAHIHRIASIAATAALIVGLMPGLVSAALPDATASTEVLADDFAPGGTTAFRGELDYHATSGTLSRLTLVASFTGQDSTVAPYIASYLRTGGGPDVAAGSCSANSPFTSVSCTFRNVRAGQVASVIVGVQALNDAEAVDHVLGTYVWQTSGPGSGGDDSSHGDTWTDAATASESGDGNYGAGFGLTNNWSLGNNQTLTETNGQAAKLNKLARGIVATVEDGPDATAAFVCVSSTFTCPTKWIGEAIQVQVAGGATQSSAFEIVVSYPNGTPAPKVYIHVKQDGSAEQVFGCAKKNPTIPCFTWDPQLNQATILTNVNAGWRG